MNGLGDLAEKQVVVVGAAALDVVGRLREELQNASSNPAHIRTSFGGVARNVAENLVRLGQPVSLLSVVGRDRIGDELLDHTRQAGVDVSAVFRSDKFPTGFYMGMLDAQGRRLFAFDDMRVLDELTESYLSYNQEVFEKAGLVFLDANLPEAALQTLFELAHSYHLPVCADTTSSSLAPRLLPYLKKIKLIAPNSTEAGILTGRPFAADDREAALDAARTLVNQGVGMVFVTLAEAGVCYATSETNGHIPALRTQVADPTGAGDALTAAIIFALLNDIDLDDAARLGVAAASLTLRHPGAVLPELSLEMLYDELQA